MQDQNRVTAAASVEAVEEGKAELQQQELQQQGIQELQQQELQQQGVQELQYVPPNSSTGTARKESDLKLTSSARNAKSILYLS